MSPLKFNFRIVFSSLWLVSFFYSTVAFPSDGFQFKTWFQVNPFGQDVAGFGFDAPVDSQHLPAFGFSADPFQAAGEIHFYRWELLSKQELLHVTIPPGTPPTRSTVRSVAISRDNKFALIASDRMDVIWFDISRGEEVARYSGHRTESHQAAISLDNKYKAIVGSNNWIWIWGEALDTPVARIAEANGSVKIEFTEDEKIIRVYGVNSIKDWNWETGQLIKITHYSTEIGKLTGPSGLSLSPDKSYLVGKYRKYIGSSETDTESIIALDTATGMKRWDFDIPSPDSFGHPDFFWSAEVTPNGKCVVASASSTLYALNPSNGQVLAKSAVRVGAFYITFDPSGQYLIYPDGVEVYELPDVCR